MQNGNTQPNPPGGADPQPNFGVAPGVSYNPNGQGYGAPANAQVAPGNVQPAPNPYVLQPNTGYVDAPAKSGVMETVIIIILGLVAATFIGLFIWMYIQYDDAKTDVDGQVAEAVAIAVAENTTELQAQFTEEQKSPYESFTGPSEYGSFSFYYPKTWSVYISDDNDDGGDYVAYFHPTYVYPVSNSQIFALRFSIKATDFDSTASKYENNLKKGTVSLSVRQINGTSANYYVGTLPDGHEGRALIIKVRDKVVTLQTDAEIYAEDFETLLGTITFIQ